MHITINNAAVMLGGNYILEQVNLDIKEKDKIAIVGRNGAGKTTLLKALINNDLFIEGVGEDKFSITKIGNPKFGYLEQITFSNEENTLLEEIESLYKDIIDIDKKIKYLENNLTNDKNIKDYNTLLDRYKYMGGYSYKKEYEVMLNKFGFSDSKDKKISSFSGGEKTKIALMKLLLSKPDFLLLDEPTNHLDIDAIEWLESYLKKYDKGVIIVSHDRMFINNIVNVVYDIDYGETVRYVGNYTKFEELKKLRYDKALKDYNMQQKEIKKLTAIYERFRNKPSKASLAMSRLHQLEKMDILERPNEIDLKTFKTNLSEITPSVKKVLTLNELEIGYDKVLAKINLEVKYGDKIAIIGKNGIGKSTLLKTIEGKIEPISGSLSYGLNINPGYFDQDMSDLNPSNTVLDEFRNYLPNVPLTTARSALGSFLFKGEDVFKTINNLSGGEKVRLKLCKILYSKPNLLILDEPTNHMDIVGKEHLENILSMYTGTLIFVSHDRYFVSKIASKVLYFDNDNITLYDSYEEYIKDTSKEEIVIEEKKKETKKEVIVTEPKVNIYNLKKDLNKIENDIIKCETKIKELNNELFTESVYSDYEKSDSINKKIKLLNEELEELNNKWESITNVILENK